MNNSLVELVKQKVINPEEGYMRAIAKKEISLELTFADFRGKLSEDID